ncbi:hypothetical protein AB835_08825 [Candidatus Endobugula sertula]|uniref:PilZ domain-containing protein n=1 Tax=Candidatus Endobugula sertula TaxID=62101 RepID=A0A1D2QPK2_9GAMM|nr:hypothetical protein AB835_08825 [Candidatus Endobugula sertula]
MSIFNRFLDRLAPPKENKIRHPTVTEDFTELAHYSQLMKLQDDRQLLEVRPTGHTVSFQSMIVGIDFINGTFSLDEFSPQLTRPESLIDCMITIRHQKGWKMLEMQVTVIDWSPTDHCYYIELPNSIHYEPRRHHNRLTLARNNVLNTHISPLYGAPWYATIQDISLGGMRVSISGDLRPHLHKDTILPKCQIILSKQITISCQGRVKAFSYINKPYRHTEISIKYERMNQQHQEDLQTFIHYIEVAA